MRIVLTRVPGPAIARCELTHLAREPIDVDRAAREHAAYCALLEGLECRVHALPPEPELPDAVFVEDAAVVLDELAVLTRPGAASRRAEVDSVAAGLAPWRRLERISAPATLDGGDVLRIGREVWVGESSRTNAAGVRALRHLLDPLGYEVHSVPLEGCLHLKSAVTAVGPKLLLANRDWIDLAAFPDFEIVDVDPTEPAAANALPVGETVVFPEHFPATRERLTALGLDVRPVPAAELAKAEGAVTCCSLIFEA